MPRTRYEKYTGEVEPEIIETTYADLRPTDLVIDKAGNAWPIADPFTPTPFNPDEATFYLCDPVTKVKMHFVSKPMTDPVTVSRVPSHADEAAKLEADFPKSTAPTTDSVTTEMRQGLTTETTGITPPDLPTISDSFATMEEAVAAVEEIGGTVEAEVTAEEVDAASAATEDAPVQLPAFADMTPLECRSHLYLLHGIHATDVRSNDELAAMHDEAHRRHDDGSLKSAHIPHIHGVA